MPNEKDLFSKVGTWLLVTKVFSNTEAQRIGLQEGDHIEKYDGVDVGSDVDRFGAMLSSTIGRENIPIIISRAGEQKTLSTKGGGLGISVIPGDTSSASGRQGGANDFMTLSAYGRFVSGFGWLVAFLGIIGVILGISSKEFGIIGILGGVFTIIFGVGLVVNGQIVSCFVSIERNTRASVALLEALAKTTK